MGVTPLTIFDLAAAGLLPVLVAVGFYLAEKRGGLDRLSYWPRQVIIGISFGIVAMLATEFGIPLDGAVVNVRSAGPLTAGLIFGWPAGLISGFIGGIHRWLSDAGDFTRLACSLGTIIAGIVGATVRRFMLDNKKASWFYGLAVGVTTEVIHMLMVFLASGGDIRRAFGVVQICAIPMIVSNGLSVMLAILVITRLGKRGEKREKGKENISQTFQRWLLVCVLLAFMVTMFSTNAFQVQIANAEMETLLRDNVLDVRQDIQDTSDRSLLAVAYQVAEELPEGEVRMEDLQYLSYAHGVTEINLVDDRGINILSNVTGNVGFDFATGRQSAEFLCLLLGEREYVQSYQPKSQNSEVYRKYAGVALPEGGFLQVGYDAQQFQKQIDEQVVYMAQNRHIGSTGSIIICTEEGTIVSDRRGHTGESITELGQFREMTEVGPFEYFSADIYDEPSFCMYAVTEGYYILGVLPKEEALFAKGAAVYMLAFMEIIVFAVLFALIFALIKRLVVENIRRINASLGEITGGNLNVTVDVRDNEEFASLSDDINSTVATLKHYIDEAAARFDKDLEIAKTIQHSALPSVFPPYPSRKDFGIFASMDAAKEVGGDFYDFYLLDENHLAFVVADVSGKGIPGAMFMMTSKTLIKSHAESGLAVNDVFTQVNAQLCENNEAGMFVTAWMGVLDLETGLVRYANAGHNPPVVKRKDGSYEYLKGKVNFVLAGMDFVRYAEQQIQLQPGDEIYLYTDGVTEAHNAEKELFGEDRLLASLNAAAGASVEDLCRQVKADVDAFVGEAEQFDDITMLCVRLNEVEEKKMLTVEPTQESVAKVSAFVEEQLESFEAPMKLTTRLLIAVDEIYSNIVRYSGADSAQVSVSREEQEILLVFRDNGKPYNPLEAEEPDITASAEDRAIGGLGIFMVRKMMDRVDYMYKDGQNVLSLTLKMG